MELTVVKVDGTTGPSSEKQRALLTATQHLLHSDAHFQQLGAPALSRAEINEGVAETSQGYLYLRYEVSGVAPQEFWAHWGNADHIAWKSGNVTVKAGA